MGGEHLGETGGVFRVRVRDERGVCDLASGGGRHFPAMSAKPRSPTPSMSPSGRSTWTSATGSGLGSTLCGRGRWPTPRGSVSSTATRCPDISPPARCRAAGRTALLYRPACPGRAWPYAEHLHLDSDFQWADFDSGLLDQVRPAFPYPTSRPAVVALTLRIWGHLHGLINLEVHGHLHARTTRLDKLYDDDVTQLLRSLNLERHPLASGGPDGRQAGATRRASGHTTSLDVRTRARGRAPVALELLEHQPACFPLEIHRLRTSSAS